MAQDSYDAILVGSSFASSFFLHEYVRRAPKARVLVLERGERLTHAQHRERGADLERQMLESFVNVTPWKPWIFRIC